MTKITLVGNYFNPFLTIITLYLYLHLAYKYGFNSHFHLTFEILKPLEIF